MTPFEAALAFTLPWETGGDPDGGYTCDPVDPGGATCWGISVRAHPEVDVERLSREQAAAIYRENYWDATGAQLPKEAAPLALALFDFAVNSGESRANRELQTLVGATPDGVIGPKTCEALLSHAYALVGHELCRSRRSFLSGLVKRRPALSRFSRGWTRRVDDLEQEIDRGMA